MASKDDGESISLCGVIWVKSVILRECQLPVLAQSLVLFTSDDCM